jgi:hypothetical protein
MLTDYEAYQSDNTPSPERLALFSRLFADKWGYTADECEVRPFMELYHVRLGPCYQTRRIRSGEVMPGMIMLIDDRWERVGLIEGDTVLTESDNLITLPEEVIIRQ